MKTKPDLGIENPYALDDDQFQAAIDLLKQQREIIGEYWSDYTKEQAAFTSGDSVLGTTWQVIANLLVGEKVPVETVLPKEGSTGWSDTWMIAKNAKHPNCMYMWMNHIISPKANAAVAEWFGEAPSNAKSCDDDRCQGPLRHVPRRGRGLLQAGLVLDDSDEGVPRRAYGPICKDYSAVGPGLDRGEGVAP